MSIMAVGDEELLDYVIEKDMEDAVSRIILGCLKCFEKGTGRKRLSRVMRGKDPGYLIDGREKVTPFFGRLSQLDEDQVLDFIESLTRLGLVQNTPGDLPMIEISERGRKALLMRDTIPAMIPWPLPAKTVQLPKDRGTYQQLKEVRNRIARDEELPPYCIATNITLVEIVNRGPKEISDLEGIKGFGPMRLERFGDRLLGAISSLKE